MSQVTNSKPTHFIVVTGGPGAGKTAILEMARTILSDYSVRILPESATILFRGGFWRRDSIPAKKGAQRAIFHVQSELEKIILDEGGTAVALCDRGTIDGLAYWPGTEEEFFSEIGSTRDEQMARYAAVIHLRVPTSEQGYNHQNPIRSESPDQAMAIDQKLLSIWSTHPNRYLIESSHNFLDKVTETLRIIHKELAKVQNGNSH